MSINIYRIPSRAGDYSLSLRTASTRSSKTPPPTLELMDPAARTKVGSASSDLEMRSDGPRIIAKA